MPRNHIDSRSFQSSKGDVQDDRGPTTSPSTDVEGVDHHWISDYVCHRQAALAVTGTGAAHATTDDIVIDTDPTFSITAGSSSTRTAVALAPCWPKPGPSRHATSRAGTAVTWLGGAEQRGICSTQLSDTSSPLASTVVEEGGGGPAHQPNTTMTSQARC